MLTTVQENPLANKLQLLLDRIERPQDEAEEAKGNEWTFVPESKNGLAAARFAISQRFVFADNESL